MLEKMSTNKRSRNQQTLDCFFAKRTCVSPAVVADQTAVLTDDSNIEEVATSEALSESDGSGTESQSGESESDVCSTACHNEDEATLDLEAETDGAAVSDTVTQSIRGYVEAVRAALSGRSQSLSDTEKRLVIENKKPSEQTVLPSREYPDSRRKSGTSTRSLLLKWFDRYDWLAYFGKSGEEGVFCAPCVLFPTQHRQGSSRGDYFITKVHRDWKHTCGEAADHEALQYHRDAVAKMTAFMATDAEPATRVDLMQSLAASERISANRAILRSVLSCLDFAARQGLALRGHRDEVVVNDAPQGNFLALVKFAIQAGDSVLKAHLDRCSRNASYISKTIQNELLVCMADELLSKIVDNVKASHYFAVLADEVSDVSGWEQLGISLRYVENHVPVEKLVRFVACRSVTGAALCTEIRTALNDIGVDEANCRAQGYDGAGAMSGHLNGCQKIFRDHVPLAHYYHCSSHQLNLALTKSCAAREIQCMISDLKSVGLFFKYSPKRQRAMEVSISAENSKRSEADQPPIRAEKVKMLCETRWVERHTALTDFRELYPAVVHCLQVISGQAQAATEVTYDAKSVTEANGLLHAITSDSFIVSFACNIFLFGFTKCLSVLLQGSHMDILTAYSEITSAKDLLRDVRTNCDVEFAKIFKDASELTSLFGQNHPEVPRLATRQTHRNNISGQTPEVYWRRAVFVPFVDNLIAELDSRFSAMSNAAVQGFQLLPPSLPFMTSQQQQSMLDAYRLDLPDATSFDVEIRRWKKKWEGVAAELLPKTICQVLGGINAMAYPNVTRILHLLLVIPVTTATVERSNSALKIIKTDLRNRMTQERLNALILLYVHKTITIDYERVLDRFAKAKPRRLLLLDPTALDAESYS